MLLLLRSSIIPAGVHDTKPGPPITSSPTFAGWNPSTSFVLSIVSITFDSSICFGRGN